MENERKKLLDKPWWSSYSKSLFSSKYFFSTINNKHDSVKVSLSIVLSKLDDFSDLYIVINLYNLLKMLGVNLHGFIIPYAICVMWMKIFLFEKKMTFTNSHTKGDSNSSKAKQRRNEVNGALIKFQNKYCLCNKRAVIRISESVDDPNKLCYCCRYGQYRFFRFWCPTDDNFECNSWFEAYGIQLMLRGRVCKTPNGIQAKMLLISNIVICMLSIYILFSKCNN